MNDDPIEGSMTHEATEDNEQSDVTASASTVASLSAKASASAMPEAAEHAPQLDSCTTPDEDDTLARALLSFCADGPDRIMYTLILASEDGLLEGPAAIVDCLRREQSCKTPGIGRHAQMLHHALAASLLRFGPSRVATARSMLSARMSRWLARYALIPDRRDSDLYSWISADGKYWILTPQHSRWPKHLGDLSMHGDSPVPLCLWGQGRSSTLTICQQPVAIVGSRELDGYGRRVTQAVATAVGGTGHVVISGGAMGADACAHQAAIGGRGGPFASGQSTEDYVHGLTVAVFAGGLDHLGPARNLEPFDAILSSGGTLVSELSPGTIPTARRFLIRNRIIAALAGSVVVTQARLRSGALNTAHWANALCREVYAVPGMITTPNNAGCNALIHDHQAESIIDPEEVANLITHLHGSAQASSQHRAETTKRHIADTFPPRSSSPAKAESPTGIVSETGGDDRTFTPLQHRLLAIIRAAPSKEPLRAEILLSILNRQHAGKAAVDDSSSPSQPRLTIEQILTALGALEIAGTIAYNSNGLLKAIRDRERQSP